MDKNVRHTGESGGPRLVLAGVSFAFACGFASLGQLPGAPGVEARAASGYPDAAPVAPEPALGAGHPELVAAARPASVPGAVTARTHVEGALEASAISPPRVRTFAPDGGELAWRAIHGGVDGRLWRALEPSVDDIGHGRGLAGIGFPGIVRSPGEGMRVYRPLVVWRDVADGRVPIAGVRCMGLSPAAVARRAARYEARIVELAIEHGVSASLVKAVITEESCFDPTARSPVGAIGLMQLMPATAAWLEVGDPKNPDENLQGGIRYLAMLRARYAGDTRLALAAYNAGPGNVKRYGGVPPFAETRRYLERVTAHHRRYVAATALATR